MTQTPEPSRRWVLTAGAVLLSGSSAGCLFSQGTSKGATDVVIHNEAEEIVSVSVTITDADATEPRLRQTVRLEPTDQATPTQSDKLPVGGDYTIEIAVEGGPTETYRWSDVRLERAPLHVIVDGSSNIVFALQVG